MTFAMRPTGLGRHGAVFKYDLLTALGAFGCSGDKHRQRRVLRFVTLITARYDWRHDRLTTGQREIAALWGVDARTVKREIAALRGAGWLVLRQPAARGRVACHGLGVDAILADTREVWSKVGPDFEARMAGPEPEGAPAPGVVQPGLLPDPGGPWGQIAARMRAADAAGFAAWIAPLRLDGLEPGTLRLRAPSAFHASFVRTHHAETIRQLASAVVGPRTVEIVV